MREEAALGTRYALTVYVAAVALAGVVAAATLPAAGLGASPLALGTLLVLTAWVGSRAVHVSRLRIDVTAGDAFMFCGLVVVGPMAAPLIAVTGVLGAVLAGARRPKPLRAVFNLASVGLAAAVAGRAYVSLPGSIPLGKAAGSISLLVAAAVFAILNTVLVAVAIRLERGTPFFAAWRGFAVLALNSAFAGVLVGLGLQALFTTLGALGLFTGIAACVMFGAAAQTFRDRSPNATTVPNRSL